MRNNGNEWSRDELELLAAMKRDKVPMRYISQILGRSQSSITHAVRNTMFHHLIDHHPEHVAQGYNMTLDNLVTSIVPQKYSIPLPSRKDADDCPEEQGVVSNMCSNFAPVLMTLAALCVGGISVFGAVMCKEWSALTSSS